MKKVYCKNCKYHMGMTSHPDFFREKMLSEHCCRIPKIDVKEETDTITGIVKNIKMMMPCEDRNIKNKCEYFKLSLSYRIKTIFKKR